MHAKKSQSIERCREVIENLEEISIDPPSCRGDIKIAIRGSEELDRKARCRDVSRSCRDCLKIVFQEGKNTDMNAIKHTTQLRIQSIF